MAIELAVQQQCDYVQDITVRWLSEMTSSLDGSVTSKFWHFVVSSLSWLTTLLVPVDDIWRTTELAFLEDLGPIEVYILLGLIFLQPFWELRLG